MRICSIFAVSTSFLSICTRDGTSFVPPNYKRLRTFLQSNAAEKKGDPNGVDLKISSSSYFVQTTSSIHHFQEGPMQKVPSKYLKEHEVEKSIEAASERAAEFATEKACEAAVEQVENCIEYNIQNFMDPTDDDTLYHECQHQELMDYVQTTHSISKEKRIGKYETSLGEKYPESFQNESKETNSHGQSRPSINNHLLEMEAARSVEQSSEASVERKAEMMVEYEAENPRLSIDYQLLQMEAERSVEQSSEASVERKAEMMVEYEAERSVEQSAESSAKHNADAILDNEATRSKERSTESSAFPECIEDFSANGPQLSIDYQLLEMEAERSIEQSSEASVERKTEMMVEYEAENPRLPIDYQLLQMEAERSVEQSSEASVERITQVAVQKSTDVAHSSIIHFGSSSLNSLSSRSVDISKPMDSSSSRFELKTEATTESRADPERSPADHLHPLLGEMDVMERVDTLSKKLTEARSMMTAEQTTETRILESISNHKANTKEEHSQENGNHMISYEFSKPESTGYDFSQFETSSINLASLEKACQKAVELEAERSVEAKYEAIAEQNVGSKTRKELRVFSDTSCSPSNDIYSKQDIMVRPVSGSGMISYLDSLGHAPPIAFSSHDSTPQIVSVDPKDVMEKYAFETPNMKFENQAVKSPHVSSRSNNPWSSIPIRTSGIQSNHDSKGWKPLQIDDGKTSNQKELDTHLMSDEIERKSSSIISNEISLKSITPGSSYTIQSGTKLRLDSSNSVQGLKFSFSNSSLSEDERIRSPNSKKEYMNTVRKEDYEEQTAFVTKSDSRYCTTMKSTTQSKTS